MIWLKEIIIFLSVNYFIGIVGPQVQFPFQSVSIVPQQHYQQQQKILTTTTTTTTPIIDSIKVPPRIAIGIGSYQD